MSKRSHNYKGYYDLSGHHWDHIKRSAFKRKITFDIDIYYVWDLFISQRKKCALSGLDIILIPNRKNGNPTASLDRIDNSKGYIYGNVQWLHKDINNIKGVMDEDLVLHYCKSIYVNNLSRIYN